MTRQVSGLARWVFVGRVVFVAGSPEMDRPAVYLDLVLLLRARVCGQLRVHLLMPSYVQRSGVVRLVFVRLEGLKTEAPTVAEIALAGAAIADVDREIVRCASGD